MTLGGFRARPASFGFNAKAQRREGVVEMTIIVDRPNKNALNSALDIYRDAMRTFIASRLEIDAASIDVNDFPRLIERNWNNLFEQRFKKDRYVPDKMRIIVEGRNQAAHPGPQDMELRHATTYMTLMSDVLDSIGRSEECRRVQAICDQLLESYQPSPPSNLDETLKTMIERLDSGYVADTTVIPWATPVPSFGDPKSRLSTLGLNPSPREFVDTLDGNPLREDARRLPTLESLGLTTWGQAGESHIRRIWIACRFYFSENPYDRWFKHLDDVISEAGFSYYAPSHNACHFDLVPFATENTWDRLSDDRRVQLLDASKDTLGFLLRDSSVQILVLNGQDVFYEFQIITNRSLTESPLPNSPARVYQGKIDTLAGVLLGREIHVLGFSAYIQDASDRDKAAIKQWLTQQIADLAIP